jgi:polar amino acid transport system ATP-binding protein
MADYSAELHHRFELRTPPHMQRCPHGNVSLKADALLKKVGPTDKRDAFSAPVARGQKQRVGVARALTMHLEQPLFDEPTSSLDPDLLGEALAVTEDPQRDGMTLSDVTHEMSFARETANRIMIIDRGRRVETAVPETFFPAPQTERKGQFLARYAGTSGLSLTRMPA